MNAQTTASATRAAVASPSGLWRDADEKSVLSARGSISAAVARRGVVPSDYRTLHLDRALLARLLASAPREFAPAAHADSPAPGLVLELPIPASVKFARFQVEESPIMEVGLAARYPEIHTYVARGIDNPALLARLDVTPQGFHALILAPSGQIFVDPYFADGSDPATAIAYYKRDYVASRPFECTVLSPAIPSKEVLDRAETSLARPTGTSLRVYRLALAATAEYSAAVGGGTVAGALGSMITTMNRVDAVYERDFSIRMVLISNTDQLIYTDPSTEPYTNDDAESLLDENQTNCDTVIGSANYDIGHVFSTAGGGLAGLGVVSTDGSKAEGETGTDDPTGDPYSIDYVAHEMGHQFGANHTFNSTTGSCGGGNRNAATAYEPGSGTTIMAYAGICSDTSVQDLAPHSDDYFHTVSYDEIDTYTTTGNGKNAFQTIATGNRPPSISVPTAYTIPISTPFALTAAATDADGDRITYCWEEFDKGAAVDATTLSGLDNGAAPLFRSYAPTTNPTRFFPSLTYILNNANVPPLLGPDGFLVGEALPSRARPLGLNFRCTVRDNRAGGGGSNYVPVKLTVVAGAGPFTVTAPNTAATLAGGSVQTVTWNVANTSVAPVSCSNVRISLSTDGGLTFPIVLADSTPNVGTAVIMLPNTGNVATTQGRIKIEAVGNIFFDISDANLTITSTNTAPTFTAQVAGITLVRGTPAATSAAVGTVVPGSNVLSSVSVSGAPDGVTLTGTLNGNSVVLTGTAECRVTTTNTSRTYPVSVTVMDTAGSTSSATVNVVVVPNPAPTLGDYAETNLAQNEAATVNPSAGLADENFNLSATPFTVVPAALPGGGAITVDQTTGAVTIAPTPTTTLGTTTVRVVGQDECGAAVVKFFDVTVTAAISNVPAISSPLTASGIVGNQFTYQITATKSPTSYGAVGLPAGLTIDPATGVISGEPTQAGTFNVTISATNSTNTGTATLTLTFVAPTVPVITSGNFASGQAGQPFTYQIVAANNPKTYAASGLPPGLTINPATGLISGTPTVAGTYDFTFSASNGGGTAASTLNLIVGAAAPPANASVITLSTNTPRITANSGQTGQFILTRTGGDLTQQLMIPYQIAGSAVGGTDYLLLKGVKKIKPGKTTVRINVIPLGEGAGPGTKRTVTLQIEPGSGYFVGTNNKSKIRILGQ